MSVNKKLLFLFLQPFLHLRARSSMEEISKLVFKTICTLLCFIFMFLLCFILCIFAPS